MAIILYEDSSKKKIKKISNKACEFNIECDPL